MPNTSSAKKALRRSTTRRERNRPQRTALKTIVKKFRATAATLSPEAADAAFRETVKRIDQAAAKRLIHKKKAARTKSRLARLLKQPDAQGRQ